jgi:hypothetical protein
MISIVDTNHTTVINIRQPNSGGILNKTFLKFLLNGTQGFLFLSQEGFIDVLIKLKERKDEERK